MTKKLLKISTYKTSVLQGRFEFATSAGSISIATEHPRERMLMQAFGVMLIALFFLYVYFVAASILNVMARKEALAKVDSINGEIGSLEQRYLALSDQTTAQEGESLGLSPVGATHYVYRPGSMGAVTMARNAI